MKAIITLENEKEFKDFVAGRMNQPTVIEDSNADEEPQHTQEEEERFRIASDIANVCDYLEDNEVIKIRLIISKCEARKEKHENQ